MPFVQIGSTFNCFVQTNQPKVNQKYYYLVRGYRMSNIHRRSDECSKILKTKCRPPWLAYG